MTRIFTIPLLLLFFHSIFSIAQENINIIPFPQEIVLAENSFTLSNTTQLIDVNNSFESEFFRKELEALFELKLSKNAVSNPSNLIVLQEFKNIDSTKIEHYSIEIQKDTITINYFHPTGLLHAYQSLLQLIVLKESHLEIPALTIHDYPKFAWRGMHLDVSRHFFDVDFVKKYIDLLAMYKFNTFHWHLTDDQGWRIEIKKYPKLTEVGAWRSGSMIGHYIDQKLDSIKYGGFYTQDQIKEVVDYAQKRHITIIPEIEMPGHSIAALAAYPEYSCSGGPFEVRKAWGIDHDVFCPYDKTFDFLQDILDEVMQLFPSEYIHIGGDECPKTSWKASAFCQDLIKKEGLKDEYELQSYFINRIEKYLNSKGRQIIGWDEILEGGLAPNATVMSWRGIKGGIAAAKEKHKVVMTPGTHCYFDHYQGFRNYEPIAIHGFTPLEKVYAYQPIPSELTQEEAKYIQGVQANVWTEYINAPEQVTYMILPRMLAMSEVAWGTADTLQYPTFRKRVIQHFNTFEKKGLTYSKSIFQIKRKVLPSDRSGAINLVLSNAMNLPIYYSSNGKKVTKKSKIYQLPLSLKKSNIISSAVIDDKGQWQSINRFEIQLSKATNKKVVLKNQFNKNFPADGTFSLVNGILADPRDTTSEWLAFYKDDFEAILDFEKPIKIKTISLNFLEIKVWNIFYPKEIILYYSNDGIDFKEFRKLTSEEIQSKNGKIRIENIPIRTQFLKVFAKNNTEKTEKVSKLFVDEIIVE